MVQESRVTPVEALTGKNPESSDYFKIPDFYNRLMHRILSRYLSDDFGNKKNPGYLTQENLNYDRAKRDFTEISPREEKITRLLDVALQIRQQEFQKLFTGTAPNTHLSTTHLVQQVVGYVDLFSMHILRILVEIHITNSEVNK